jgi:hypothetical protein
MRKKTRQGINTLLNKFPEAFYNSCDDLMKCKLLFFNKPSDLYKLALNAYNRGKIKLCQAYADSSNKGGYLVSLVKKYGCVSVCRWDNFHLVEHEVDKDTKKLTKKLRKLRKYSISNSIKKGLERVQELIENRFIPRLIMREAEK